MTVNNYGERERAMSAFPSFLIRMNAMREMKKIFSFFTLSIERGGGGFLNGETTIIMCSK
mgnify:CR=1 FL=1